MQERHFMNARHVMHLMTHGLGTMQARHDMITNEACYNSMHGDSKHIERRVHWFREQIRAGTLRVQHVPGTDNMEDLFTKCLGVQVFQKYRDSLLRGDFSVLDNGGSYMCIVDDSTYPFKWTDASNKKCTCLLS
jgi:hypothetical protein